MTRVFIDTDVIIDWLADRKPFSESAARLFSLIESAMIEGFTSSQTISNLYYILRKVASHKRAIDALDELMALLDIIPVDQAIIKKAIRSGFGDFEDAIQHFTAQAGGVDVIVTRNIRDFKKASIAVMSPEVILSSFEEPRSHGLHGETRS